MMGSKKNEKEENGMKSKQSDIEMNQTKRKVCERSRADHFERKQ